MIKNCSEPFKTGIWDSQNGVKFLGEETIKASINIQLMRVGLVISVDQDYETWMDHIVSAPATLLWLK